MAAEILLTIANNIISRETITGAISLVEFFRQNPKWLKDSYTVEAKISLDEKEKSKIFLDFIKVKMSEHEYSESEVDKFSVIYHELVSNAFDHGCVKDADEVVISVQIAFSITILVTLNPKGRIWDLESSISNAALRVKSGGHRGRGLLLVKHLAGDIHSCNGNQGVKVVFAKAGQKLKYTENQNILEITVYRKGDSDNFHSELGHIIRQSNCGNVILSIVGYLNSREMGAIVSIHHSLFLGKNRTLVLCGSSEVLDFFQMCGLDDQIKVFKTTEAAKAYLYSL